MLNAPAVSSGWQCDKSLLQGLLLKEKIHACFLVANPKDFLAPGRTGGTWGEAEENSNQKTHPSPSPSKHHVQRLQSLGS